MDKTVNYKGYLYNYETMEVVAEFKKGNQVTYNNEKNTLSFFYGNEIEAVNKGLIFKTDEILEI